MKFPSIAGAQNVIANTWPDLFGAWTILDHDTQLEVCSFDCFYAFGYNKQSNVVQYPIENGSFATYNKQNNPFRIDVSLVKNGLNFPFQKKAFISTLQDYCDKPFYVDVVTPSGTYLNCTLSGLSFENSAEEWADAIKANLTVTEVRHTLMFGENPVKTLNISQKIKRGLRTLVGV
jgi:hypothetical protein